jgi:xylulokinase
MVADVMDTRVVCPLIGEAAALGGAIQAAWCDLSRTSACEVSLESLCERLVAFDDTGAIQPAPAAVAAYEHAYQRYVGLVDAMYHRA